MSLGTVYLRREWAAKALQEQGGLEGLSQKLGVHKGTISRQVNRKAEASGKFVAAVLLNLPVEFGDAFQVVETAHQNGGPK